MRHPQSPVLLNRAGLKVVLVVLLLMSKETAKATASLSEPTAALPAMTSEDPQIAKARRLVEAGDFTQARKILDAAIASATGNTKEEYAGLLDFMERIHWEYSLDERALLTKVRAAIPDATESEVSRWASETKARYRIIDGTKFYFRREPRNIFLFSAEAKKRSEAASKAKPVGTWTLTNHLAEIIAEAERTGATEVMPVRHRLTHTVTIHSNHPALKPGAVVRAWLPFPQAYRQQRDVRLISSMPEPKLVAPNAVDGNPVTAGAQRTIYFEQVITDAAQPVVFKEVVEFTSYAYYPKLDPAKVQPLPENWNGAYLAERPPHIVFPPDLRKEVGRIISNETNALTKAQKIFRWVSANIPWCAEDEYCIIPSFTMKGFTARRGDCGVQNTVFISMCRVAGIPARWQSGYETKPVEDNWGMHDWAEIYIAPWGWLPADASYGVKKSRDPRIADFYCGHQDSYRFIVNLDWGRELFPPKTSVRSEPADFQRGEVEVDGKNLYFNEWDDKTEVERERITTP